MKTLSRTCTAVGCAALLTFTGTTAANAAGINLPKQGSLLAGGAGVSLSITFDCEAGRDAFLFVDAAQKVDDQHAATGTTLSDTVTCAAGEERVEVALLAAGDFTFIEGDAVVQILLSTCDTATCDTSPTATGVVQFTDASER